MKVYLLNKTANKKFHTEDINNMYNHVIQINSAKINKNSHANPTYEKLTTQHYDPWDTDHISQNTNNLHDKLIHNTLHNKDSSQNLPQLQLALANSHQHIYKLRTRTIK